MKSPVNVISDVVKNIRTLLHDLNNLITIVHGQQALIQKALEAGDTEGAMKLLAKSQETVARLQTTAKSSVEQPIAVPVNQLLHVIAEDMKPEWLFYRFDFHKGESHVWMKYTDLYRVVLNIWKNAIEAMESTPNLKHEILMASKKGTATTFDLPEKLFPNVKYVVGIRIWNNGPQLVADPVCVTSPFEYLFKPGFSTKTGENRGIGLASVRQIVKANGGFLKVKNEPTGGVSFYIFLPEYVNAEPAK